jgi:hypothetical protein
MSVPFEEIRARDADAADSDELVRPHVEPDGPLERMFGAEGDRKGWGRAAIRLNTHPLHRMPRITRTDLLLPNGQNPLRLAGDCVVIGVAFALLAFFPLMLVALTTTRDLRVWMGVSMGAVGLASAAYVFFRAWSPDTRDLDRF